nr:MAG TPA: Inhibitor of Apoptosis domain [Caudoviricetes sp.]
METKATYKVIHFLLYILSSEYFFLTEPQLVKCFLCSKF